jgi:HD-GYP domain-containing protein (c-di-GMP phosphodiesterase class II)
MSEALQCRVKDIAKKYRWRGASGHDEPILTDDEVHNLTISKGTLTPEERDIINYHVVATIKMLEALPYPKHLRNVPKYAGVHHERMDGRGYPNGLTREQIPIQGRIISIADIFESLTAKDRPYQQKKTLMEALRIMGLMSRDGQIDPDLFEVFLTEQVSLHYARQYLDAEQLDDVAPADIPGYSPAP